MRRMTLGTRNTPAVTRKAVTMRSRVWNLLELLAISQMATTKKMTDGSGFMAGCCMAGSSELPL